MSGSPSTTPATPTTPPEPRFEQEDNEKTIDNPTDSTQPKIATPTTTLPSAAFLSLPVLGGKGSPPLFKGVGDDVQDWVDYYELAFGEAGLTDKERCMAAPRFWNRTDAALLRLLPEYQDGDWNRLKDRMIELYPSPTRDLRYSASDLEEYCRVQREKRPRNILELQDYVRGCQKIGLWLLKEGAIEEKFYNTQFWQGLHKEVRERIEVLMRTENKESFSLKEAFPAVKVYTYARRLFDHKAFDADVRFGEGIKEAKDLERTLRRSTLDVGQVTDKEKSQTQTEKETDRARAEAEEVQKSLRKLSPDHPKYATNYIRLSQLIPAFEMGVFPLPRVRRTEAWFANANQEPRTGWNGANAPAEINAFQTDSDFWREGEMSDCSGRNSPFATSSPHLHSDPPCLFCGKSGHLTHCCPDSESYQQAGHIRLTSGIFMLRTNKPLSRAKVDGTLRTWLDNYLHAESEASTCTAVTGFQHRKRSRKPARPEVRIPVLSPSEDTDSTSLSEQLRVLDLHPQPPPPETLAPYPRRYMMRPDDATRYLVRGVSGQRPYRVAPPIPEALPEEQERILFVCGLDRIWGKIAGYKVQIVVDSGSEVNVMSLDEKERLGCYMERAYLKTMVTANDSRETMVGVCPNVSVEVGGLQTRAHIHVTRKAANFEILLGQPWIEHVRGVFYWKGHQKYFRWHTPQGVGEVLVTLKYDPKRRGTNGFADPETLPVSTWRNRNAPSVASCGTTLAEVVSRPRVWTPNVVGRRRVEVEVRRKVVSNGVNDVESYFSTIDGPTYLALLEESGGPPLGRTDLYDTSVARAVSVKCLMRDKRGRAVSRHLYFQVSDKTLQPVRLGRDFWSLVKELDLEPVLLSLEELDPVEEVNHPSLEDGVWDPYARLDKKEREVRRMEARDYKKNRLSGDHDPGKMSEEEEVEVGMASAGEEWGKKKTARVGIYTIPALRKKEDPTEGEIEVFSYAAATDEEEAEQLAQALAQSRIDPEPSIPGLGVAGPSGGQQWTTVEPLPWRIPRGQTLVPGGIHHLLVREDLRARSTDIGYHTVPYRTTDEVVGTANMNAAVQYLAGRMRSFLPYGSGDWGITPPLRDEENMTSLLETLRQRWVVSDDILDRFLADANGVRIEGAELERFEEMRREAYRNILRDAPDQQVAEARRVIGERLSWNTRWSDPSPARDMANLTVINEGTFRQADSPASFLEEAMEEKSDYGCTEELKEKFEWNRDPPNGYTIYTEWEPPSHVTSNQGVGGEAISTDQDWILDGGLEQEPTLPFQEEEDVIFRVERELTREVLHNRLKGRKVSGSTSLFTDYMNLKELDRGVPTVAVMKEMRMGWTREGSDNADGREQREVRIKVEERVREEVATIQLQAVKKELGKRLSETLDWRSPAARRDMENVRLINSGEYLRHASPTRTLALALHRYPPHQMSSPFGDESDQEDFGTDSMWAN